MLRAGERVPDATVWVAPREQRTLEELGRDGAMLLFFYLFDWSST